MNEVGHESGNAAFCEGRDLPWLQETEDQPVWTEWEAGYRDVVILDAKNRPIDVFNLTDNDLEVEANFEALRTLFEDAAP